MTSQSQRVVRLTIILLVLTVVGSAVVLRVRSQRGSTLDSAYGISAALRGFTYVGESKCLALESPPHDSDPKAFPDVYLTDHCYVFHVPSSAPQELYSDLESQMIESGVKVMKAPQSAADFVYLVSGGPLFQIQFQQGRRQGTITTLQHPRLRDSEFNMNHSFRQEDIVLRYSQ